MWAPLLFWGAVEVEAKPLGWFRDGASSIRVEGARADLEMYRGPTTSYLPTIAARLPVEGQEALRPVLAVVDLAGGWNRVSVEMARALGLEWSWTRLRGEFRRVASLDRIELDGVLLEQVHLEVVPEAPGLVLGFASLDEVAVAILSSEALVRIVPAKQGDQLIKTLGEPLQASAQPSRRWTDDAGTEFGGNGITLRVPGALRWGEAVVSGTFHLRTDAPTSLVAPSSRLPEPIDRGGEPFHDVGALLSDVWLSDTWIRQEPSLSDPAPDFWAALGYDVLFGLDIGVYPARERVAFRRASVVSSHDATELAVEFARARFDQEEERTKSTSGPDDERPEVGFKAPTREVVPLGDPGDPVIRDRNLDLAETLWHAGELDASLPHYLAASRHAGDYCKAHLVLAERRLAWAGPKLATDLVAQLVIDPLERAAYLWSVWEDLDDVTQEAITEGQDLPEGTLQVFQPSDCRRAHGLLMAVYSLRGERAERVRIERSFGSSNASVAYMKGLSLLSGSPAKAEGLLAEGMSGDGVQQVDAEVALAMAKASLGKEDEVIGLAKDVAGLSSDHPLTAAFGLLAAAQRLRQATDLTRKLKRVDARYVPGLLVHAMASGEEPPPWDFSLEDLRPGSPQVLCQRAVHLALQGRVGEATELLEDHPFPSEADWWSARAVVSHFAGDAGSRDEALLNLRLRFPMIPLGNLGLK